MAEKRRYMVYIDSIYLRNTQAYLVDCPSDEIDILDEEHEANWLKVSGYLLVLDMEADSLDEVFEQVESLYPDADYAIFKVLSVPVGVTEEHYF